MGGRVQTETCLLLALLSKMEQRRASGLSHRLYFYRGAQVGLNPDGAADRLNGGFFSCRNLFSTAPDESPCKPRI